ncbi:MAG: hypothetical protein R2822_14045 [Spirosomataceae bacterium]
MVYYWVHSPNTTNRQLPESYFAGSSELGLHITTNSNCTADIAIFREGQLQVGFHSTQYADTPPSVVIEVDIKIDESDYFKNEEEYFLKNQSDCSNGA